MAAMGKSIVESTMALFPAILRVSRQITAVALLPYRTTPNYLCRTPKRREQQMNLRANHALPLPHCLRTAIYCYLPKLHCRCTVLLTIIFISLFYHCDDDDEIQYITSQFMGGAAALTTSILICVDIFDADFRTEVYATSASTSLHRRTPIIS